MKAAIKLTTEVIIVLTLFIIFLILVMIAFGPRSLIGWLAGVLNITFPW